MLLIFSLARMMKMITLFQGYIDAGYKSIFFLDEKESDSKFVDETNEYIFDEETLKDCLHNGQLYLYAEFIKDGYTILFKPVIKDELRLSIDDIPATLAQIAKYQGDEREDYFRDLQRFLSFRDGENPLIHFSREFGEYAYDDPYLDDEEHIALLQFVFITRFLMDRYFESDFDDFRIGFDEINAKRGLPLTQRNYSDSAMCLFLLAIEGEFEGKNMPIDLLRFYQKNIFALAGKGNYEMIKSLGYNYYEGINGFELDFVKSEQYLKKAYEMRKDPSVANTLGYIYYYGRNTNGVPDKEKAFQYFAIAHFAGGYFEATYKLSDCYMKGYGTPINEEAAFALLNSIYEQNRKIFCDGVNGKYADICLRLASFYDRGGPIKANKNVALTLALFARCAIKERLLQEIEYPGDRSVAVSIFKLAHRLENEAGEVQRNILDGGYSIDEGVALYFNRDFNIEFSYEDVGLVRIRISGKLMPYQIAIIDDLRLCERVKEATFLMRLDLSKEETRKLVRKKPLAIELSSDVLDLQYEDETKDENYPAIELIYLPQTLDYLDKSFVLLTVCFSSNGKEYFYLYQGDGKPKVGDTVVVDSNGRETEVIVTNVEELYEDQLPLPKTKMGIARSRHFA